MSSNLDYDGFSRLFQRARCTMSLLENPQRGVGRGWEYLRGIGGYSCLHHHTAHYSCCASPPSTSTSHPSPFSSRRRQTPARLVNLDSSGKQTDTWGVIPAGGGGGGARWSPAVAAHPQSLFTRASVTSSPALVSGGNGASRRCPIIMQVRVEPRRKSFGSSSSGSHRSRGGIRGWCTQSVEPVCWSKGKSHFYIPAAT